MTGQQVQLRDGEHLLIDPLEVAYRQIAPHLLRDGRQVATHAFGPLPADAGMPSYSRSSIVTAQEARDWFSANAASDSEAVYGVTVEEVIDAGSVVVDDSESPLDEGEKRAPGHCFVNFRGFSKNEKKDVRTLLYMSAMKRGEIPTKPLLGEGILFEMPATTE